MERFLDYVLRQLIERPEEMVIVKEEAPGRVTYRLQLSRSDIGKVVGKGGSTIQAIRNLVGAAAAKHQQRASVELADDDVRRV